jgi:hypothetical protein
MKKRFLAGAVVALGLLAAPARAGEPAPGAGERVHNFTWALAGGDGDGPMESIVMMQAEESFEAKVVRGAPYQAEAVNEFVQTLADGNRIVRRSTSTVARDSEGRTRREGGMMAAIGPMLAGRGDRRSIFINDPVAGVSWILQPREKVARKVVRRAGAPGRAARIEKRAEEKRVEIAGDDQRVVERIVIKSPGDGTFTRKLPQPEMENLGSKVIEGVEATGTRSTVTIPAGEMGNEKPMAIVTERWYSAELNVVVMTRHSDPRGGESTFRLTQISRGEPERSLFEVPADYTVKEGGPLHHFKMERHGHAGKD